MKDIAFVYTKYQHEVLRLARKKEGVSREILIVMPSSLKGVVSLSSGEYHEYIMQNDRKKGGGGKLKLKREVLKKCDSLLRESFEIFWLASDDHPACQIMLKKLNYNSIFLFEDGIGSYVKQSLFNYKRGGRALVAKIINIVYFFPYYSSLRLCGSIKANKYFSYFEGAFPLEKNDEKKVRLYDSGKIRTRPESNFTRRKVGLIVGQPLYLDLGISEEKYCSLVLTLVLRVKESQSLDEIIYKPHPRECEDVVRSISRKLPEDISFSIYDSNVDVVQCLKEIKENYVVAVSFMSTSLMHFSLILDKCCIYAVKSKEVNVPSEYYDVIKKFGINIIKL
jgi:hypothetical protein